MRHPAFAGAAAAVRLTPVRILIVPDKFKGTLPAHRVAAAIAAGWRRARPTDHLDCLPLSDGGDGFGPVLGELLSAKPRRVATLDAAHRPCRARWWWAEGAHTAIIETAQSNGLALLPQGTFHPFDLDTFGIGKLIQAALDAGAKTCLLGVGGSATNDGGFGLARARGWRFLDRAGTELLRWTDLHRLSRLEPPVLPPGQPGCRWVVATDVSNALLGPQGASRVYGPQKGLRPEDMAAAERSLRRLAAVVRRQSGFDSRAPGSGAAGGLGFGLQAFLGAERRLGFDIFAELAQLESRIRQADLVLTGEGGVDRSSLMGKGVGQLLDLCARHGTPAMVLAGRVDWRGALPPAVLALRSLVDFAGEAAALKKPAPLLTRLARELAATLPPGD